MSPGIKDRVQKDNSGNRYIDAPDTIDGKSAIKPLNDRQMLVLIMDSLEDILELLEPR